MNAQDHIDGLRRKLQADFDGLLESLWHAETCEAAGDLHANLIAARAALDDMAARFRDFRHEHKF